MSVAVTDPAVDDALIPLVAEIDPAIDGPRFYRLGAEQPPRGASLLRPVSTVSGPSLPTSRPVKLEACFQFVLRTELSSTFYAMIPIHGVIQTEAEFSTAPSRHAGDVQHARLFVG